MLDTADQSCQDIVCTAPCRTTMQIESQVEKELRSEFQKVAVEYDLT